MINPKSLRVYKDAFTLSKKIFLTTEQLNIPFRLKDQLFGSSTSICANLAEMSAFDNKNYKLQKIRVCIGETNETEFWIDFLQETTNIPKELYEQFTKEIITVRKQLLHLLTAMKQNN